MNFRFPAADIVAAVATTIVVGVIWLAVVRWMAPFSKVELQLVLPMLLQTVILLVLQPKWYFAVLILLFTCPLFFGPSEVLHWLSGEASLMSFLESVGIHFVVASWCPALAGYFARLKYRQRFLEGG